MRTFPICCVFKNWIFGICRLLNQLLQSYSEFSLRIHIILNYHFGHFYVISYAENLKNYIEWNFNILYTFVLFKTDNQLTYFILVMNRYLMRMFKTIAIFAQNVSFYRFIFCDIFYLQFIHFYTFGEIKRPFVSFYNKIPA